VWSDSNLEQALADIARGRDEAILAFADGFTMSFAERIAAFSVTMQSMIFISAKLSPLH
jgi:hypothetical protein